MRYTHCIERGIIMKTDYYDLLGVPKKADEKAIKTAYRKLARKYHPDLNPGDATAEAKFKQINDAYEVLSNPEKRKAYDRYGDNWQHAGQVGASATDINFNFDSNDFGSFFGQFFGGGQPSAPQQRRRAAQPADIHLDVELSLAEIHTGTKRTLSYRAFDACKSCDATGQVRLRAPRKCSMCKGSGQIRGIMGMAQVCPECEGSGDVTLENCPTCGGDGVLPATRKVEVKIPAGIQSGKKLRVPGRGSTGANNKAGDLYVTIRELPHPKFSRQGDNLVSEVSVPYLTALLGGEISVETLSGKVSMHIPECTQSGQSFRLAKRGITLMNGEVGNLLVKVNIAIPSELTPREREVLSQLQTSEVSK